MKEIKFVTAYKSGLNDQDDNAAVKISYIEYDQKGNVICSESYNDDGSIESKTISVYNKDGFMIEESQYFDENEISEHTKYVRDDDGELLSARKEFAEGYESEINFERSKAKKTLDIITKDEDGELEEREFYKFDDEGKMLVKCIYNYNDDLTQMFDNEYDDKGRLMVQTEYGKAKEFISKTKIEYDEEGNLTKQVSYNRKGEPTHWILLKYDDKNRVIEQQIGKEYLVKTVFDDDNLTQTESRIQASGIVERVVVSKMDEDGRILEENDGLSFTKYVYEYF